MSNTNYSLGINKPLIKNEQDYVLDRRLLTVHAIDRDITKWHDSNTFELVLPEALNNVQSMRLVQMTLPSHISVFSNNNQNTTLTITRNGDQPKDITIDSGYYYTGTQLANELTNKINATGTGVDPSFVVVYNEVSNKFYFGNNDPFTLNFDQQVKYDISCNNPLMWCYYANWGLPYYLGFDKKSYPSSTTGKPLISYVDSTTINDNVKYWNNTALYYVVAPYRACIQGEHAIYMEVEKYNNCYDEVYPYNQSSKEILNNNAYNGRVNSAFAKIPIYHNIGQPTIVDSHSLYLQTMVQYDPPLERLARLKFKFRYHDGRLVDFQNCDFDFTIEFNCLRNEIHKKYNIRVPPTYSL